MQKPLPARRGMSAVEVMVGVMVAAAVGIPMLTLLFQERDTEQRSRFEYVALLAARDEAYQARMLAACGIPNDKIAHDDFKPLPDNPLDGLQTAFPGTKTAPAYSPEQKRISLKLKLDPVASNPRLFIGTVTARWVDPTLAASQTRKTSLDLVFGVLRPAGQP